MRDWVSSLMRAARFLLAGCLAGLAACAAQAPTVAPAAPATEIAAPADSFVGRHGRLQVQDGHIVDAHGAPVALRGMSLFWSQWMGQYYSEGTVRWLAQDWDATAVRAAIAAEPNGYIAEPEREMEKARTVIEAAIGAGVYVIVDWHAHRPHANEAAQFFSAIAARYGGYPNLIYETWNEPLPDYEWARDIKPYHERVIAAIRAYDPDNLIVAGTGTWSQDVDVAAGDPLSDSNLAYALHYYAGTHREALREKARTAMARGATLMVTEYGVVEASGGGAIDEAESRLWWDFLEQNKISHLAWAIDDKAESSAALRAGASGEGGWPDDMLTPAGKFVRAHIRAMNRAEAHEEEGSQ
jgi:endoglucanase